MSRVAKMPVNIPAGVQITAANGTVTVKGAKSTLNVALPDSVSVDIKDGVLNVQAAAGVVSDSQPEAEGQETEAKARAVLRAAEIVEAGLSHGD